MSSKAPSNIDAETVQNALNRLKQGGKTSFQKLTLREIGTVTSISIGVVTVSGLPGVGFEELVQFPSGILGIAYNIEEHQIGVVLLGEHTDVQVGDSVERTGRVADVPVGEALIGRVMDPLGRPLDDRGELACPERLPIERPAPGIMERAPVSQPLQTGIKVIDAMIPIGRGQRELILGDRQTGKTAIAVDTIINQKDKGVICVYCAIGQRTSSVAKVIASLKERGAMEFTVVMVAEGNSVPGLKYVAPYAATSVAEYFMEQGNDVLVVYDDLTIHARAYRELSLLLRRPTGREAFTGDIFYIHSRLLERATKLNIRNKGGSLTALPIIETEAQNISAYIPTNLISITDGQIYLSPKLFELGNLPAIDVGKSVSRVGGKAQLKAFKSVAGLKLEYAQFEEMENFARFGTRLDDRTRAVIGHGRRIRECLKQNEMQPLPVIAQLVILFALSEKLFDNMELADLKQAQHKLAERCSELSADMVRTILDNQVLGQDDKNAIVEFAEQVLAIGTDPNITDRTATDGNA